MKVLVTVKRVIDPQVKVRVKSDGSGVETANIKMAMNPFCEIAVEQAVRMKEAGVVTEIVAVSIGAPQCQETLRTAMAMGADRGILVETGVEVQPLGIAKLLKAIVDREKPQVVIGGKQAIDDDANQVGQMLAAFRAWPQAVYAPKDEIEGGRARRPREVDGGMETTACALPVVISPDLRLFLATGILGGFTTYSSFNYEALGLVERGAPAYAGAYVAVTVLACLASGTLGLVAALLVASRVA